jgi:hypothetical protein
MATLTNNSLSLVIDHFYEPQDDVDLALGLFCNGVPILQEVSKRAELRYISKLIEPGYVWTGDHTDAARDLVAVLRPAVMDRLPRMWHDMEQRVRIMVYPPAYAVAMHSYPAVLWDGMWPTLAGQATVAEAKGGRGKKLPAQNGRRPQEANDQFLVQVCICPTSMGYAPGGNISLELCVPEAALLAFFDDLRSERKAFLEAHRAVA